MNASLPTPSPSYQPPGAKNSWRERIGLYALGLAIGLLVLGTIRNGKKTAMQRAQQQMQQNQPQPPPDPGTAPPARDTGNEPLAK